MTETAAWTMFTMDTPIGVPLASKPRLRAVAVGVGLLVVVLDFYLTLSWAPLWWRSMLGMSSVLFFFGLLSCNRESIGLRFLPRQPISYWVRAALIAGVLVLIPCLAFAAMAFLIGWHLPIPRINPEYATTSLFYMCVTAPLLEEPIYRLTICVPATVAFGPTRAIILSGGIFAALHILYGNPGPDNFLAGYVLAWAYLKSGSLMVPVVLHSLGNSVAFAFQLAAWYVA